MSTRSQPAGPLGSQTPRHASLPKYSTSAGREAVDLAAQAGLHLDPWQAYVLEHSLGETDEGRWAAAEVGLVVPRQNGKGSILEARELAGLFLFGERLILHSAHEFKTATEGFLRIKTLIEGSAEFSKRVKAVRASHGEEGIELKSGARLRFVARSRGSGRGFSGDLVILDEAYALPDSAMDALMPTLSARPNAQIWYTSSAPLADSTVLRRLCVRGRGGEDPRLAYFEWCADDDARTDDRAAWAQANPAYGRRLSEAFTERELAALSPEGFLRERLGVWHEDESSSIISAQAWAAMVDPRSQIVGRLVFALDISPDRSVSTIAVAGARADGDRHVEVVEHRPGTDWVLARFAELRDRWGIVDIVVDARSAAGSFIPDLERLDVNVVVPSTAAVAAAAGRLFDACGPTGGVRHIGQPVLDAAVAGAVTRPLGDAWTWDRRKPEVAITPLTAVTLALWGFDADEGAALQIF